MIDCYLEVINIYFRFTFIVVKAVKKVPINKTKMSYLINAFGTIMGLNPLNSNKRLYNSFSITMIFFIVIGYITSEEGRVRIVYQNSNKTVGALDGLEYLVLTFVNCFSIYHLNFQRRSELKALNWMLDSLEKNLFFAKNQRRINCGFWFLQIFLLVLFLLDGYIWVKNVGWFSHAYYTFQNYQYYHLCILVLTMHNYLARFNDIANVLKQYFKHTKSLSNLKRSIKSYIKLVDAIDQFNNVYGWPLLFVFLNVQLELLEACNLVLVYTIKRSKYLSNVDIGIDLLLVCMLWIILLLVSEIAAAFKRT